MNRIERRLTWSLIVGFALLVSPAGAGAAEKRAERTRPSYHRDETRRPEANRPSGSQLPPELRAELNEARDDTNASGTLRRGPSAVDTRPSSRDDRRTPPGRATVRTEQLSRDATEAAAWAAKLVVRDRGRLAFYRVGFHSGILAALNDPHLGNWDHAEGVRVGRRDPEAGRLGAAEAREAAREIAGTAAREKAERQFMDLTREPRYLPQESAPRFVPPTDWTVVPTLDEVFGEVSAQRHVRFGSRYADAFDGWRYDPWTLSRCASHTVFFERGWNDWSRAFELWRADSRRARSYRKLRNEAERELFARVFRAEFRRAIARLSDREILPAHRQGFDDGWQFGALVVYEWRYRLGYTEGFDLAASRAARGTFPAAYADAFERHYRFAFDEWSESVRPGILDLTVSDANDDGIFQPGETILVDFELVNYGGAAGRVDVALHGSHLERLIETAIGLERRSVRQAPRPIRAAIRAGTPARTRTVLTLELDGSAEQVGLLVSYPLEFTGRPVPVTIDALAGKATVEVRLANRSRKAVEAFVDLTQVEGYAIRDRRALGALAAGRTTTVAFELSGIRPLDLLAGRPTLAFTAKSGGTVHDGTDCGFPDLATDLSDDALLRYMLGLSMNPGASFDEIAGARDLMLRRLRADWRAAARAKGNPYKQDNRSGGATTALGALVAGYEGRQKRMARPEVFNGFGDEIESLAGELPGMHPFLRKHMKKLARRIDPA